MSGFTGRCYSTSLGCPGRGKRCRTQKTSSWFPWGGAGSCRSPEDEPSLFSSIPCDFIQTDTENPCGDCAGLADSRRCQGPLLASHRVFVGRYHAEDLAPELPECGSLMDNSDLVAWPRTMLARKLGLSRTHGSGDVSEHRAVPYAWLKISDGCRHACLFCRHPQYTGRHRSTARIHDRPRGAPCGSWGSRNRIRGAGSHGLGGVNLSDGKAGFSATSALDGLSCRCRPRTPAPHVSLPRRNDAR